MDPELVNVKLGYLYSDTGEIVSGPSTEKCDGISRTTHILITRPMKHLFHLDRK